MTLTMGDRVAMSVMDLRSITIIGGQELRGTWRNRWFLLHALVFGGLAFLLSAMGLAALGRFGITGFGRTEARLLHFVMVLVPLMGLLMGAMSIAVEREHGTLLTLMAQPVTSGEVLLGKFLGRAAALTGAILLGFGASGLVIARAVGVEQLGTFLSLAGWTVLLGIAQLALGFFLSTCVRRGATALGLAPACWLVIVLLSDLGMMGAAVALRLSPAQLLWVSLANPAQAFKLAAIGSNQSALESLGPASRFAADALGPWLLAVVAGLLVCWTVGALAGAWRLLQRRGAMG